MKCTKNAALDVTMGIVAFIPVVGWVISGTYLILDISGVFGEWGVPSGISQSEFEAFQKRQIEHKYGDRLRSLRFEMECSPTIESSFSKSYMEQIEVKIDNTRVALPKIILERN
ncbi:hypothetical protein [Maribacter luteus]|uniref:hypothetical protein n=1 Tax=Maribacter luteus TaxID=2594478 RepID=UPI0024926C47|nr:hypothetical protein [Maribacter luteus]